MGRVTVLILTCYGNLAAVVLVRSITDGVIEAYGISKALNVTVPAAPSKLPLTVTVPICVGINVLPLK